MNARILPILTVALLTGCGEDDPIEVLRDLLLQISPNAATVNAIGDTISFAAVVRDAGQVVDDVNISWSALTPSILSVTPEGEAVALEVGTGMVEASANDGEIADTVSITVQQVDAAIEVTPGEIVVIAGGIVQAQAAVVDSNSVTVPGRTVTWSSNNESVATVNSSGLVTGVALGSTTITVSSPSLSTQVPVTVSEFNEPAGYVPIVQRGMNSKAANTTDEIGSEGWAPDEANDAFSITTDETAPLSPPNVGFMPFPAQAIGGGSTYSPGKLRPFNFPGFYGVSYRKLYVRYAIQYSENFQGHNSSVNKQLFIWMDTQGGRFVSRAFGSGSNPLNLDVAMQGGPQSSSAFPANVGGQTGELSRGDWHIIEFQVEMNSFNGSTANSDGILRVWIDGDLTHEYTNMKYMGDNEQGELMYQITHELHWGGLGGTIIEDMFVLLDDIYVSGAP